MKRDMELIRKMVLAVEDHPRGWAPNPMQFDGYSAEQIGYHCYLLVDAGLAAGTDVTTTGSGGPSYRLSHLTSAGHDFADSAREGFIWDEAMTSIREKGFGTVSLDVLKKILDKVVRKRLGDAVDSL